MANISNRICKMCGEPFTPNSCHQIYCKRPHYMVCPICGKSYLETNVEKFKRPPTACSKECKVKRIQKTSIEKYGILAPGNNPEAREKSKKTMNERYGVDYAQSSKEIKDKSIATWINKYGVDNPQKNIEIRNKTISTNEKKYGSKCYLNSTVGKELISNILLEKYGTTIPLRNEMVRQNQVRTNLEKYGVDNPAKLQEIKDKIKQTSLRKYGTEYPQSSDIIKQRIKDTFIRNYGVDNCFKSKEIIDKIHKTFFNKYGVHGVMNVEEIASRIRETNMKRYGVPYYIMLPNVAKSSGRISNINKEMHGKLLHQGIDNKLEFNIGYKSYDIIIPQGNILLEIDPSYTHSTVGNHWNHDGIPVRYHLDKSILAEANGYRCIHLWDWDCISKFINLIEIKNTIYDKIIPEDISIEEAKEFISKYSLYEIPDIADDMIFIGMRYKSKLINLIGFKRNLNSGEWHILCIEHRFHYTCYNGNNKILDYFISKYIPFKIITYVDYSKSNGEMVENMGFIYTQFRLPVKIWSKGRHAILDDETIVAEAMIQDGWLPVYNCGYKVYERIISPK